MSDTDLHSSMAHENDPALEREHVDDLDDPNNEEENNRDLHSSMDQETARETDNTLSSKAHDVCKDTDDAPSADRAKLSLAKIRELFLSAADSPTGHKYNYYSFFYLLNNFCN